MDVAALARGLAAIGLRPGGHLLIMMSSRPEHQLIHLAALDLGAVPSTVDPALHIDRLRAVARQHAAQLLVLEGLDELTRWWPVLPELPSVRRIVLVEEPPPEVLNLATVSLRYVTAIGAGASLRCAG